MLDNAPPRVIALFDAFSIIQLLSEPEGLKQLKGELKPLIDAAVSAHKQLGKRQREIGEADKALQATQAKHDQALAALAKKQGEASAAATALEAAAAAHAAKIQAAHAKLEAREAKLREERAQHRQDKAALLEAQGELGRKTKEHASQMAELTKRETAAQQLMAKADALRADYEARIRELNAHLQRAQV